MVAMLPAWFRFAQCIRRYRDTREAFPHLANAMKYSTSFFVVIFSSLSFVTGLFVYSFVYIGFNVNSEIEMHINCWDFFYNSGSHLGNTNNPYFYLWIIASIVSSCSAYAWDIKMDWGLLEIKHNFLREETVYSSNVGHI